MPLRGIALAPLRHLRPLAPSARTGVRLAAQRHTCPGRTPPGTAPDLLGKSRAVPGSAGERPVGVKGW
ncbi:MAG TPA: hypothetical protein VK206_04130 [Anaerolineales bacterium]|nr:hypothetical protein [Anaerolineales bacterium]